MNMVAENPESINRQIFPQVKYGPPRMDVFSCFLTRWAAGQETQVTPIQASLIAKLIGFDTEVRR